MDQALINKMENDEIAAAKEAASRAHPKTEYREPNQFYQVRRGPRFLPPCIHHKEAHCFFARTDLVAQELRQEKVVSAGRSEETKLLVGEWTHKWTCVCLKKKTNGHVFDLLLY